MAGKTKNMSQIKQLLLLHQQGKGKKTIARMLGMSKNTVKEYLQKLSVLTGDKDTLTTDELLKLENPVLEARFHSGNPAYKEDKRYDSFKKQIPYFLQELKRKGVTRHLLWQEYRQQHVDGYSYAQFCFHIQQQMVAANPSMVLEHKPGDKLFVDFAGSKLHYTDRSTGELIACEVFVACLPFSDYAFAMALPSQRVSDFLYALECCLIAMGGVPAALVPDNLKSAVIKANRYEPTLNQGLDDFASHYNTTVIPARAKSPKDKALVENQVKLIYSRVYARLRNVQFFDLDSLNKAIGEKVREHNQTRMQQKPYCREERFLSEEKGLLQPLPKDRFEIKYYKQLKVAKNNHIYFSEEKHYYSVPYPYIGKKVKVVFTRRMVYVFHGGRQIAVHIRGYQQSGYTTDSEHLCSHHRHYNDRSPDYYLALGKKQSTELYHLMEALFKQTDKHPEQLYKSCDGLLSLSRKSDKNTFAQACQTALENDIYSYGFIKNFLSNKMNNAPEQDTVPVPLPAHENIRGREYYRQAEINFNHQNK